MLYDQLSALMRGKRTEISVNMRVCVRNIPHLIHYKELHWSEFAQG